MIRNRLVIRADRLTCFAVLCMLVAVNLGDVAAAAKSLSDWDSLPKLSLPKPSGPLQLDTGQVFTIEGQRHYLVIESRPGGEFALSDVNFSQDGKTTATWRVPRVLWYLDPIATGVRTWIIACAISLSSLNADILVLRPSDGKIVDRIHYRGVADFGPMRPHSVKVYQQSSDGSVRVFITPPMHSAVEAYGLSPAGRLTQLWRAGGIEYYCPQWLDVVDIPPWGATLALDSYGTLYFYDISSGSLRGRVTYYKGHTLHISTGLASVRVTGDLHIELLRAVGSAYSEFAGLYDLDLGTWTVRTVWQRDLGTWSKKRVNLQVGRSLVRDASGREWLVIQYDDLREDGSVRRKVVEVLNSQSGESLWRSPGTLLLAKARYFIIRTESSRRICSIDGRVRFRDIPAGLQLPRYTFRATADQPVAQQVVLTDGRGQIVPVTEDGEKKSLSRVRWPATALLAAYPVGDQYMVVCSRYANRLIGLAGPAVKQPKALHIFPAIYPWKRSSRSEAAGIVSAWGGPGGLLAIDDFSAVVYTTLVPWSGAPPVALKSQVRPLFLSLQSGITAFAIQARGASSELVEISGNGSKDMWDLGAPAWEPRLRLLETEADGYRVFLHNYHTLKVFTVRLTGEIGVIWEARLPHECSREPVIVDYNGDGHNDIIIMLDEQLYCLDGVTGNALKGTYNNDHWGATPVAGTRADGKPILLLTGAALGAYDWDTFKILWSQQPEFDKSYAGDAWLTLDFDGDGGTDILRRIATDKCVIYDGETGAHLADAQFPSALDQTADLQATAFSLPTGRAQGAIAALASSVAIYTPDTPHARLAVLSFKDDVFRRIVPLSADGRRALLDSDKELRLLDVTSAGIKWEMAKPKGYLGYLIGPDPQVVGVVKEGGVEVRSLHTGRVTATRAFGVSCSQAIQIGDGQMILIAPDKGARLLTAQRISR